MAYHHRDRTLLVKTHVINIQTMSKKNLPSLFPKIILSLTLLWLGGFVLFIIDVLTAFPPPPLTDGIVVLTGGAKRIDEAIRLFKRDCSQYLLISGVGSRTTLRDLQKERADFPSPSCQNHISLGHNATSTMGNAIEAAAWVHTYHLESLTIITSNYHIRRGILEFQNLLSDTQLYPYAIPSITIHNLFKLSSGRLLFIEYNKLLMAYSGLIHTTRPKQDLINLNH